MKVLKQDTQTTHSWYKTFTIPKGTPVSPATNLPKNEGKYFVDWNWDMPEDVRSWLDTYGVLVTEDEVEEVPAPSCRTGWKLPEHLFVTNEGHMFDTRREEWYKQEPLRENYARPAREFPLTPEGSIALRAAIRQPYAWPGGYERIFFTEDGGCLCHKCVRDNYHLIAYSRRNYINDGWQVAWATLDCEEEEQLNCDNCNKVLVQHEGEEA